MNLIIKKIEKKYYNQVLNIYNYYIENSFANFEEKKINLINFKNQLKIIKKNKLPFLVALEENKVVGIAYLTKFREKSGYRFVFENTIYVHKDHIKKGIGTKLLINLLEISKKNTNIKKIIAVIGGIDNESSIKIHKKNGFKKMGVLENIGFKKGRWINAIFFQKDI